MVKRLAALLSGAIVVLGLAGILMGSGYIVNERKRLDNETPEAHENLLHRERKTGWTSIGAGVGVIAAGGAIYGIVANILDQLSDIQEVIRNH